MKLTHPRNRPVTFDRCTSDYNAIAEIFNEVEGDRKLQECQGNARSSSDCEDHLTRINAGDKQDAINNNICEDTGDDAVNDVLYKFRDNEYAQYTSTNDNTVSGYCVNQNKYNFGQRSINCTCIKQQKRNERK